MTQIAINTQVNAIKKATQDALKSKESALKFLMDAGIVKDKERVVTPKKETKITKK